MINCQQEVPGVWPIFGWGNHLGEGLCKLCKSKPTKQTGCFSSTETSAFLHSPNIIPCCQDFTTALNGASEMLSCYLWTRLCSCNCSCKIGMWDFFGFILILPRLQPRCLLLGRYSSVLAWLTHHPVLIYQPGHCKACSCGICFGNLSSEQRHFVDLHTWSSNFYCKSKFSLASLLPWD